MKKVGNVLISILLIISSIGVCVTHLADKLFEKDLGHVAMKEVVLSGQLDLVFKQVEDLVPKDSVKQFEDLKNEIKNNKEIEGILNTASRDMLDDVVDPNVKNHEIKGVVKDMVYSYEKQILEVLNPFINKKQLHSYVDSAIETLPVQLVYDSAVESFQESIPADYQKGMKLVNLLAKPMAFNIAIGLSIFFLVLLLAFNWKKWQWTFSLGLVGILAGCILFALGRVVPEVYHKIFMSLDQVLMEFSNEEFKIITQFGIGYLIAGIVSLGVYFMMHKKKEKID